MPNFLKENEIYFYRIVAISDVGEESNATEEFKVFAIADLSDPINFSIEVLNTKVKPIIAKVSWDVEGNKSIPDYWTIERKFESQNDSFAIIGKAYVRTDFFDRNLSSGNTYIYRIKSFDAIGRESAYFETRLTI